MIKKRYANITFISLALNPTQLGTCIEIDKQVSDDLSNCTSVLPDVPSDDTESLVYVDTLMNDSAQGSAAFTIQLQIEDYIFDSVPHDMFSLQLFLLNIFQLTKLTLDRS